MDRQRVWNGDAWDFGPKKKWSVKKTEFDLTASADGKVKSKELIPKKKRIISFSDIARCLRAVHKNDFSNMNFLFCSKIDSNRFFIFQDISSLPIQRVVSKKINYSLGFYANWTVKKEKVEKLDKKGCKTIEWGDFNTNNIGAFNPYMRFNPPVEENPTVHFRIEDIYLINVADTFFEIYSDTISMIGVRGKKFFPHKRENRKGNLSVGWTGCKFTLSYDIDKKFIPLKTEWFWTHKKFESGKENDIMLEEASMGNERKKVKDIGQRDTSNIIIEENNESS